MAATPELETQLEGLGAEKKQRDGINRSFVLTPLSAGRDEKNDVGRVYSFLQRHSQSWRDVEKEVSAPPNEDHESPKPIKKLVSGAAAQKMTRPGHKPREPIPEKWSLTRLTL